MANKVIHVPDALHSLVKDYCTRNGYSMSEWAGSILQEAVERSSMATRKGAGVIVPVEKKKIQLITGEPVHDGPKPWEQEPFWKRRSDRATDSETEEEAPTPAPETEGKTERLDQVAGDGQGA